MLADISKLCQNFRSAALGMISDFVEFIKAVVSHWVEFMSGAVSLLIDIFRRKGNETRNGIFFYIALACWFLAAFSAWRDQYAKTKDIPRLWAQMQNTTWFQGDWIKERTADFIVAPFYICINAKLGNDGTPTAVEELKFTIPEFGFTATDEPLSVFTTNDMLTIVFPSGNKSYFKKLDSLVEKTGNHQLLKNTPESGYLWFSAPHWVIERIAQHSETPLDCELSFSDGREHPIVYTNKFQWRFK